MLNLIAAAIVGACVHCTPVANATDVTNAVVPAPATTQSSLLHKVHGRFYCPRRRGFRVRLYHYRGQHRCRYTRVGGGFCTRRRAWIQCKRRYGRRLTAAWCARGRVWCRWRR